MRLKIIYNPNAGRGFKGRRLGKILECLTAKGASFELYRTKGPGDATIEAARSISSSDNIIVAAGGDGTINEVINGLMKRGGGELGIIPLGTANILALEIGLSLKPEDIAQTLLNGKSEKIALGQLIPNDNQEAKYFCLMAGAGFDAHVVKNLNLIVKKYLGKTAYGLTSLVEIIKYDIPTYQVSLPDQTISAASVIVSNVRHYAGPYMLAPEADIFEPCFHVCLYQATGRINALNFGYALLTNSLMSKKGLLRFKASEITLTSSAKTKELIQVDGELSNALPITIRAISSPISLKRPRSKSHIKQQRA